MYYDGGVPVVKIAMSLEEAQNMYLGLGAINKANKNNSLAHLEQMLKQIAGVYHGGAPLADHPPLTGKPRSIEYW